MDHSSAASAPVCPGPDPHPHGPRTFTVVPGAVDTHAHIIGLPPEYGFVEGRSYTRPEASPAAYLHMLDGGVGLRLNVLYGGGIGFESLASYADLARDMGWHPQILLDVRQLADLAPRLSQLPVPVVVDHMGHFPNDLMGACRVGMTAKPPVAPGAPPLLAQHLRLGPPV